MPDPAESSPTTGRTDADSAGPLDTVVRPDGGLVLHSPDPRRATNFGPAERDGDLGKLGRYRILKKLGEGGMGAVYLGSDAILTRRVALKIMLPQYAAEAESRERFLREARAAAVVRSDHVVTIHDVGEERGVPFIAMEYLLGHPLDQFLRTHGDPPLGHVVRIGRETALGLAAAHKLGLVHRDVKPGNIWLEAPRGRVKLLDFGLARAANEDTHLTTSGLVVGTPAYMSPEQARNGKVDGRSDLFSLGVMLYRLASGRMPFGGGSTMAVLTSLAVDVPPPVRRIRSAVPEPLEAVIAKLLAKNPDDRYQTAREVADALSKAGRPKGAAGTVPVEVPMAIAAPADGAAAGDAVPSSSQPFAIPFDGAEGGRKRIDRPPHRPPSVRPPVLAAVAVGIALAAALAGAVAWPSKGTLVVEADDPGTELVVKKDGTVIRDRTPDREIRLKPGTYTVELAEPKAGWKVTPDQFDLTSAAPVRVRVSAAANKPPPRPSPPPAPVSDADRRGAEWVLSVGGGVRVAGAADEIRSKDQLPKGHFQLLGVTLQDAKPVTDSGLANLKDCKNLTAIRMNYCRDVTAAGLAHFKGCADLSVLSLGSGPRLTGDGLANFKGCKKLTRLELFGGSLLDDAMLANFAGCTELDHLNLGYALLITDAGVANFKGCKKLTYLNLHDCANVSDAGLRNFAGCGGLEYLNLQGGAMRGDAGLALFNDCKNLTHLFVQNTAVTPQAVTEFRRSHPKCRIEVNGGVLEAN
jgi:tRNA A-37 threonylcarbamoyl transferase component Bud32